MYNGALLLKRFKRSLFILLKTCAIYQKTNIGSMSDPRVTGVSTNRGKTNFRCTIQYKLKPWINYCICVQQMSGHATEGIKVCAIEFDSRLG